MSSEARVAARCAQPRGFCDACWSDSIVHLWLSPYPLPRLARHPVIASPGPYQVRPDWLLRNEHSVKHPENSARRSYGVVSKAESPDFPRTAWPGLAIEGRKVRSCRLKQSMTPQPTKSFRRELEPWREPLQSPEST